MILPPWMGGCSPTYDWREQAMPDVGLVTTFPCHPDRHSRMVTLAGRELQMEMLSCSAGSSTYAIGFFDVPASGDPETAATALRAAWVANIQSQAAPATPPWPVTAPTTGGSPGPGAGQWAIEGHRQGGAPLAARGAFFTRGRRVYQALVVGSTLVADAVEPFYSGLRFPG